MSVEIDKLFVSLGLDLEEFQTGLEKAKSQLTNIGSDFEGLGLRLSAAFTAPLVAIAEKSLEAQSGFEHAMNKVSALGDIYGEQLKKLSDEAISLAQTTIFSASQAADGMGQLAAAGLNAQQIFTGLPSILGLAAAGELKVGDAASIAIGIMGGFGKTAEDLNNVANVLAKAAAASLSSVQDIGEAFKYVGPIAKLAGANFNEVAAAITELSNAGVRGEKAGSGLFQFIHDLVAPSSAAAQVIQKLGLSIKDTTGAMLPMADIIKQLSAAHISLADASKIWGTRMTEALILIGKGDDALRDMTKQMDDSDGAWQKMANTMNSGLAGDWSKFSAAIEHIAIAIGEDLEPVARQVMQTLTDFGNSLLPLIDKFKDLPVGVQEAAIAFAAIAAAVGPIVIVMGTLITSFGEVAGALGGLVTLFAGGEGLVFLLTAATPLAIAFGVALAAWGIYKIATDFEEMRKQMAALDDDLAKGKQATKDQAEQIKFLQDALINFNNTVGNKKIQMPEFDPTAIDPVKNYIAALQKAAKDVPSAIDDLTKAAGNSFSNFSKTGVINITGTVTALAGYTGAIDDAGKHTADAVKFMADASKSAANAIKNFTEQASKELKTLPQDYDAFINDMNQSKLDTPAIRQMVSLVEEAETKWKVLPPAVQDYVNKLLAAIEQQRNMVNALDVDKMREELAKSAIALAASNQEVEKVMDAGVVAYTKNMEAAIKATSDSISSNLLPLQKRLPEDLMAAVQEVEDLNTAYGKLGVTSEATLKKQLNDADAYLDIINQAYEEGKAGEYEILQGKQKELELAMKVGLAEGDNITNLRKQYADTTKELTDLGVKGKTAFSELGKEITGILSQLSSSIADAIVSGKSLQDVFMAAVQAISKAILKDLIDVIGKDLVKAVIEANGSILDLGKAFQAVANDIAKMFGGLGSDASGAVSGAGGAAGSTASAASGAIGSIGNAINVITGVANAITGILGYFQNARMEQDIGRIEVTTRGILSEVENRRKDAWDQANAAAQQFSDIFNVIHDFWYDAVGWLQTINQTIGIVGAMGGGGGGNSETPVQQSADQSASASAQAAANQSSVDANGFSTDAATQAAVQNLANAGNEVTSTMPQVTESLNNTASAATDAATATSGMGQAMQDYLNSVANAPEAITATTAAFNGVTDAMKAAQDAALAAALGPHDAARVATTPSDFTSQAMKDAQAQALAAALGPHPPAITATTYNPYDYFSDPSKQASPAVRPGTPTSPQVDDNFDWTTYWAGVNSNTANTQASANAQAETLNTSVDPTTVSSSNNSSQFNFYGVTDPSVMANKIVQNLRLRGVDI